MRLTVPLSVMPAAALLVASISRPVAAATYHYVDWTVADVPGGTASGTITLPDDSTVSVTFVATKSDHSPGNLYGAQVAGTGTNYWSPSTPYISEEVENAPPGTDILQLSGGQNETYTVSLSEPIKDPIMAIVSLGQPGLTTTYDFDSPFTIVSQGAGYWGGSSTALVQLPDDVLQGNEGHGTIRFVGTFSTFSWTVPTPESWHGFTFGIRTTERIEPASEGGAGGESGGSGAGEGGVAQGGAENGGVDNGGTPEAGIGGSAQGGTIGAAGGAGKAPGGRGGAATAGSASGESGESGEDKSGG